MKTLSVQSEPSTTSEPLNRLEIFSEIIEQLPRLPLVDLGAGHCQFSRIAYDKGFPVTSVDARISRVPKFIPWKFIQSDVRDFDVCEYPIICILGLLYHLDLRSQYALLKRCAHQHLETVIVDTHTASYAKTFVYYGEEYGGEYFKERITEATAAFGNQESFWHTEHSLIRLFRGCELEPHKVPNSEHAPGRSFWTCKLRL